MSPEDRDSGERKPPVGRRKQSDRPGRGETSARTRFAKTVGARIKRRRIALGLRQEDVIRRMSHPTDEVRGANRRHTLSQYECGKAMPSLEIVVALADALETAPEWLAFGRSTERFSPRGLMEVTAGQCLTEVSWTPSAEFREMLGVGAQSVITSIYGSSFMPGIVGHHDIVLMEVEAAINDRPRAAVLSGPAGAVLGIAVNRDEKIVASRDGIDWSDPGLQAGDFLGLLLGVYVWRPAET